MSTIIKIGKAAFVHLSKTGGTSIRAFAEEHLKDETMVIDIPDTVGHITPMRTRHYWDDPELKTFVFVRNPLDWIKSTWKYWTKYPNIRPDAMRALNNPFCYWGTTFSQRLLNVIHEGDFEKTMVYWYHHDRYLLLDLYSAFTAGADYVGRTEQLSWDFFRAIIGINEKNYTEEVKLFDTMERKNVSDIPAPPCNDNLLKEFHSVNRVLCERFGYGMEPHNSIQ